MTPSVGYSSEDACDCQVPIPCNCTGRCRELGYCPCNPPAPQPPPCGHYFPWHGVIPPSYCPICGAYIGPIYANGQPQIVYHVYTAAGTTTAAPKPQGETTS